jgi:hypothetical protein
MGMIVIWQEIDKLKEEIKVLKERVKDLENERLDVTLHDAIIIRNKGTLEQDLSSLMNRLRKLIKKYGQIELTITSD